MPTNRYSPQQALRDTEATRHVESEALLGVQLGGLPFWSGEGGLRLALWGSACMKRSDRLAALPPGLVPRGLSREEAAAYIGVSPGKFDQLVADGRMPPPKAIDGRRVWDRLALDRAFAALPDADGAQSDDIWSKVAV